MNKKFIFKLFFSTLLVLGVIKTAESVMRWPLSFTNGFVVKLTDLDTGEPISGAIIEVNWVKEYAGIFEMMKRDYKTIRVMTDVEGKAKIGAHLDLHVFSHMVGLEIIVHHPLYQQVNYYSYEKEPFQYKNNNALVVEEEDMMAVQIRSLQKKVRNWVALNGEDCSDIRLELSGNLSESHSYYYYYQVKKRIKNIDPKLIPLKKDVNEIWDNISRMICKSGVRLLDRIE